MASCVRRFRVSLCIQKHLSFRTPRRGVPTTFIQKGRHAWSHVFGHFGRLGEPTLPMKFFCGSTFWCQGPLPRFIRRGVPTGEIFLWRHMASCVRSGHQNLSRGRDAWPHASGSLCLMYPFFVADTHSLMRPYIFGRAGWPQAVCSFSAPGLVTEMILRLAPAILQVQDYQRFFQ